MRLSIPVVGALLAAGAAPLALGAAGWALTGRKRLKRVVLRCCTAALAVAYGLLGAELALRWFFRESNGAGVTLASQRWMDVYWRPINAQGFRDFEVDPSQWVGKRVLWVVGDSYAAGWGIEEVRDRFSDRLGEKLGDAWRVINIAKPGWDTRRQIEAASQFPHRPDAIVHAYCLNDAERAAEETGLRMPRVSTRPSSALLRPIVEHSHLANLIYWRWRSLDADSSGEQYWDFIQRCYFENAAWKSHESDLRALLSVYRAKASHIIAVAIPNLLDVEASRPMTAKIEAWFEDHGVRCIHLTDHLAGRPPTELVVNRFDPHANESVHALIAELLFEQMQARGWVRCGSPPSHRR